MVSRNTFRSRLLALTTGAGLAAGLLGITGAQAEQYSVGEIDIILDTTISAGASMRVADREDSFLPWGNGGRPDTRPSLDGGLCNFPTFSATGGMVCDPLAFSFIFNGPLGGGARAEVPDTDFADNFDGSINSDDGRLNYDNGDLIGAPIKVTHDLEARWRNLTAFVRASYFYDAVLDDGDSASRHSLGEDVTNDIGRGFEILDAYIAANFEFGELPVTFRQGYQVINWGEATFFLNGINANPINVTAFRRPGSEIKEAFIPTHSSFLQVGLPLDLSLEAFYQWEWRPYRLDPAGSPYGGSDVLRPFDGTPTMGGSFIGGSPSSGTYRRNCDASAVYADPLVYGAGTAAFLNGTYGSLGVLNQISLGVGGGVNPLLSPGECAGSEIDMRFSIPIGTNEEVRMRNGDLNYIDRMGDLDARDGGEWGVAVRYYADWFNATEFGFYFTNTHSRLPYAQLVPQTPQVYISTVSPNTSALTRQVGSAGCVLNGLTNTPTGFLITGAFPTLALVGANPDGFNIGTDIDPNGFIAATASMADTILTLAGTPGFGGTEIADDIAANGASMENLMQINCALWAMQSGAVDFSYSPAAEGALSDFLPMLTTGAESLGFSSQHGIRLQYPEDIRMYGMSFNTTIGTWGVQGELAYRDNMPLQIDTNSLTITSGLQQCAFMALAGDVSLGFENLAVEVGQTGNCNVAALMDSDGNYRAPAPIDGFVREEVLTGDFGTTATYAASNPFVGLVGADLGIFLTEVGFAYVPDAPAEGDFSSSQLVGPSCQGSDLPLGGLLALDNRRGCRPDDFSWGYLLLARLDYNNVFGAFTVSPTVVFSHDVEGTSPAPISNYVEDTMSLSLSVGASYQNTWRASVGYNSFFGGGIANKARDQDFASVSLSYSF